MPDSRIQLIPHTPVHLLALIEGTESYTRQMGFPVAEGVRDFLIGPEISQEFLDRLNSSPAPDEWHDGFAILHNADKLVIGCCGTNGPPDEVGTVEISYAIAPGYQGRGFATEAALALVEHIRAGNRARCIRAHTLPEHNASARVLTKCGFVRCGEIQDPVDGLIWRWELPKA